MYRWENGGSGWLRNLPKITQLVSGRAGILSPIQKFLLFLLTFASEQSRPQADEQHPCTPKTSLTEPLRTLTFIQHHY